MSGEFLFGFACGAAAVLAISAIALFAVIYISIRSAAKAGDEK